MKTTKNFIAAALAVGMALTMSVMSSAETIESYAETVEVIPQEVLSGTELQGFVLVSEEQYVDENGCVNIDRLYVKDEAMLLSSSGTRTYKVTKNVENSFEMWVKGTFTWDSEDDTATVTNVSSGYEILDSYSNITIEDEVTKYDSNQGKEELWGLVGHKYAYIQYDLTADSSTWKDRHYSIYTDVNTEGERKIRR